MPMNSPQKHNFQVIDAMPGAGKTEFFVSMAVTQLKSKKPKEVLIYVAPTIPLLAEVLRRVVDRTGATKLSVYKKIHVVCDHASSGKFAIACRAKGVAATLADCPRDPPAVALNYLLGLIPRDSYMHTKYTGAFAKSLTASAAIGDIIFTTHESFMRVLNFDASGRDFSILRQCTVVFDEARQCVIGNQTIHLEAPDRTVLRNCFNLLGYNGKRVKEKIDGEKHVLEYIDSIDSVESMMHSINVDRPTLLPLNVRKLVKQYNEYCAHGRAVIYVLSAEPIDGVLGKPKSRHTIYTILRPTALFNHYSTVYLTSAFFKDSQMYHFLKKDEHDFTFLMEQTHPAGSPLHNIHNRDKKLRANLLRRLECAVLLKSSVLNSQEAYRDVLTAHLLKEGMIVPASKHDSIQLRVDPTLTYNELAGRVVGGQSVSADKATNELLREYAHPPLWILLREAAGVYVRWSAGLTGKHKALLTINASKASSPVWGPLGIHYLSVLRSMHKDGYLVPPASDEDEDTADLVSEELNYADSVMTSSWRKFFNKYIHRESASSVFNIPSSPKLHGVNSFDKLNAFVHVAALNPDPKLFFVYDKLLPDYKVAQDTSIENLVQMMYRTSLRKPDATEPVLLIVPYHSALKLLAEKIYGKVRKFHVVYEPRLVPLSYRRPVPKEERVANALKGSHVAAVRRQIYSADDTKEVSGLRISLLRLRRRMGKQAPPDKTLLADIALKEARMAELRDRYVTHKTL